MNSFQKANRFIDGASTVERLKKILKVIKLSENLTSKEKEELVSLVETRRNYIGFDLFDDYLKVE